MKTLYNYIKIHLQEDFSLGYYLSVVLFLGICIFFNYRYDLEHSYLDPLFGTFSHYLAVFGSFSFVYLGVMIIQSLFKRQVWNTDIKFWIALIFILALETHDISFGWYRSIIKLMPDEMYLLSLRTAKNFLSIFTVLLPLYLFHRISKSRTGFYGLSTKGFNYKPYLVLCFIALVGIAVSLSNGDLSSYYPTYKPQMGNYFPNNQWVAVLIYEFFYGFDFLGVEMIFRGFMVIGLARWLGKEAIMPMVAVYCILHFGKPMPEAISSIFGGFLLGILAYRSKSVLGGVMIHISIALGMEFFAFIFS